MTAADEPAPDPSGRRPQPGEMLSDDAVRAKYRSAGNPAAGEWAIAVRGPLIARFGEHRGTYQRFADALMSTFPDSYPAKSGRQLSKQRSEHFNAPLGPPWETAEEVLALCVPPARRTVLRRQWRHLYIAARGKPPPYAGPRLSAAEGRSADGPVEEQLAEVHERLRRSERERALLRARLTATVKQRDRLLRLRRMLGHHRRRAHIIVRRVGAPRSQVRPTDPPAAPHVNPPSVASAAPLGGPPTGTAAGYSAGSAGVGGDPPPVPEDLAGPPAAPQRPATAARLLVLLLMVVILLVVISVVLLAP